MAEDVRDVIARMLDEAELLAVKTDVTFSDAFDGFTGQRRGRLARELAPTVLQSLEKEAALAEDLRRTLSELVHHFDLERRVGIPSI